MVWAWVRDRAWVSATPVANRKTTKIRPWFLELDRFPRLKMYINNGINHLILFKFKNKIIENLHGSKKKPRYVKIEPKSAEI